MNLIQNTSLVSVGMGSNPIRSHFCWHIPWSDKSLWCSVFYFHQKMN